MLGPSWATRDAARRFSNPTRHDTVPTWHRRPFVPSFDRSCAAASADIPPLAIPSEVASNSSAGLGGGHLDCYPPMGSER